MTLTDFPNDFSSVTHMDLAVPSPPVVETLYVNFSCKFVGVDDDEEEE